ncbi:hypothetical protein [Burkholderia sp. LMG 32019]
MKPATIFAGNSAADIRDADRAKTRKIVPTPRNRPHNPFDFPCT